VVATPLISLIIDQRAKFSQKGFKSSISGGGGELKKMMPLERY